MNAIMKDPIPAIESDDKDLNLILNKYLMFFF